jgi:DNA-binding beta-propeller fold protein YncE
MANNQAFKIKNGLSAGRYLQNVGTKTAGSVASNNPNSWVSYGDFSVSSQDTSPTGVYIKTDGTKMYVVGSTNDTVFQYSLSTAWDVTTASYDSVSKSISAQETIPFDIFFKSDGTSMYIIGQSSDAISQYTLGTAWDISTASYSQQKSVSGQGSEPRGLYFKSDGLRVFTADAATNSVFSYTLSTAWDISTASYDSKSLVTTSDGEDNPGGVAFNQDGTFLYVIGDGARAILQYQLTTAYDLSTATITSSSYPFNQSIGGIHIKPDNTKVYLVDYTQDAVTQITSTLTTQTPDLSTGNYFNHALTEDIKIELSNPPASGKAYAAQIEVTGGVANSYDLAGASYDDKSFSVSSQLTSPTGVAMNPDGTRFFAIGRTSDKVFQYDLSTAYAISTASYDSVEFSVLSQTTYPEDIFFKPDGTKMFVTTSAEDAVFQYSLSTAWDLSTASYDSVSFDTSNEDNALKGLTFNNDGSKMYTSGIQFDIVVEYDLATNWVVSSATYNSVRLSVGSQTTNPDGIVFNNDGTKLYVVSTDDIVYQYNLTTGFDLSTASYANISFSVATEDSTMTGITLGREGTKMYLIGSQGDNIYQYSIGSDASITWPDSIKWDLGFAPTAPANGDTDLHAIFTIDGGTTYYGAKTAGALS